MARLSVWGSNTAVGKTLVSAGLTAAASRAAVSTLYLKPVQTGFPADIVSTFIALEKSSWLRYQ